MILLLLQAHNHLSEHLCVPIKANSSSRVFETLKHDKVLIPFQEASLPSEGSMAFKRPCGLEKAPWPTKGLMASRRPHGFQTTAWL